MVPALQELGVLAATETPSAADAAVALAALNRMVDQWAADGQQIYAITRTTATLTANQASFTVGTGGNINIARPVFIERVNYLDTSPTPDMEYSLGPLMTEEEWQCLPMKAMTSTLPQRAYYSPTYPTGTLYPWPIPTTATLQWVVYAWTAITEFAALSTTLALPPGYSEMIVTNLAVRLAAQYSRQVDPILFQRAEHARALVRRSNMRLQDLSFGADAVGIGGNYWPRFDIRTGV